MLSKPCDLLEKLVFIWTLKNTNIHSQTKCTFFFRININHGKFGPILNAFWKFVFFFHFAKQMLKFRHFIKFSRFFPKFLWLFLKFSRFFPKFSRFIPKFLWFFPKFSRFFPKFLQFFPKFSWFFRFKNPFQSYTKHTIVYKQSKGIVKLSSTLWWISLIPMNLTCIQIWCLIEQNIYLDVMWHPTP